MKLEKLAIEGLEGKTLEFVNHVNKVVDVINEIDEKSEKLDPVELKSLQDSIKGIPALTQKIEGIHDWTAEIKSIKDALKVIEEAQKNPVVEVKALDLEGSLLQLFEQKGCKTVSDLKNSRDFAGINGVEFKVEAPTLTTAQTGSIGRTEMSTMPIFPLHRTTAFLPFMRRSPLSVGKSIIGWTTGAYSSYVGYLGENEAHPTNDGATAVEKTRGLAKISASKILTTELEEDLPELARQMAVEMNINIDLFLDGEIYSGDGNPATNANPTHIYGLKNHATAFDSAAFAGTIETLANEADLIDAVKTQVAMKHYNVDRVWMNPIDAYKLRRRKDVEGQYIVGTMITGENVISGAQLIESVAVTANTMFAAESRVLQLRVKREITFKVGQFGDDAKYDRSSALMFMRCQVLVEDRDMDALVYIPDVKAALAGLEVAPV